MSEKKIILKQGALESINSVDSSSGQILFAVDENDGIIYLDTDDKRIPMNKIESITDAVIEEICSEE